MAASVWRMNGLCVAGVLVICALLLTNEVKCQEDQTATAATMSNPESMPASVPASDVDAAAVSVQSHARGEVSTPDTFTIAPSVEKAVVNCVGKEDITESTEVTVETSDCNETKSIIEADPDSWCKKQPCQINIFQDNKTLLINKGQSLVQALNSEMKEKLGMMDVKSTPSSSPSVFVGILVTGLLAAIALTVGYFKCQRRPSHTAEHRAEEGTPVDQQNQANTLASDAPLNPPPETPEKPSVNGESPEADKTEPPPTNGSTPAKTADTEL